MTQPCFESIEMYAALNADGVILRLFDDDGAVFNDRTPGAVSYGRISLMIADYEELYTIEEQ